VARTLLSGRAMNAHFFGAKRAFHATLRFARPLLARFGLTPARFDLLYAIAPNRYSRERTSTLQRDLRDALGVTGATICRMLQSLEKLGLIVRTRSEYDARQRNVELTDEGVARLDAVCGDFIDNDAMSFVVDRVVDPDGQGESILEKDIAETMFKAFRSAFGDRATLYYPWHPDD
jgi:DNA-binding MarR family transcriptional regulator